MKIMPYDALKFFQAWLRVCLSIGGENLPRAISTKLGSKLAKLYEDRGITDGFEESLKKIYTVLNAAPNIEKIEEDKYLITVKHAKRFCPIGGGYSPKNVEIIQKNFCIPYTTGFLSYLTPDYLYEMDFKDCIVASNKRFCTYCLKRKKKGNIT